MNVSVYLHAEDMAPSVDIIKGRDGFRFLTFYLTPQLYVGLRGVDHEAVAHARQLAAVLTDAATTLEQQLQTEQTPSAVQS